MCQRLRNSLIVSDLHIFGLKMRAGAIEGEPLYTT